MSNIMIGGVTPKINPATMTLVRPDKPNASVATYEGVAYFAWPPSVVGKTIDMNWDELNADDFAQFDVIYATDGVVTFNPNDGLGKTFSVTITSLDGEYEIGLDNSSASYRKNVKMSILIIAQL